MDCEFYRRLAQRSIEGEMSPEERKALNEHTSRCADCRRFAVQIRSLSNLLDESLKGMFAGSVDTVMQRLGRGRSVRKAWRLPVCVSAAAVLLLAIILIFAVSDGRPLEVVMRPEGAGVVQIKSEDGWRLLGEGEGVAEGSVLRNDGEKASTLLTKGGSAVTLNGGTSLKIESADRESGEYRLSLLEGDLFIAAARETFRIRCDGVEVVNRGTRFTVHRGLFYLLVIVVDGEVECRSRYGSVVVRGGEQTRVPFRGAPPEKPVRIKRQTMQKAWYRPLLERPLPVGRPEAVDSPPVKPDMPVRTPK